MQKKLPSRFKRSIEENSDAGHTDLYRWLKARYADLNPLLVRCRPGWAALAQVIDREGVKGPRGQTLSDDAVRRVWKRLCRDVEAEDRQRRTGTPAKKVANRAGPGWRPPVVGQALATPPFQTTDDPFAPSPATARACASDEFSPERLRAGLAEVLAKRSGR